ncbi:hypothetical protein Sjap_021735 [Stephania japonica]|uniref:Pentatricopeptide repeat-containing protein n=1 Tax=Stephania japonica TaxID=461633 RepID=A0AAP0HP92_9MAGN
MILPPSSSSSRILTHILRHSSSLQILPRRLFSTATPIQTTEQLRLLLNNTTRIKPQSHQIKPVTEAILGHLDSGRLEKAVEVLFASPFPFPSNLYAYIIQFCSSTLAIVEARKVESHLVTFCTYPPPPVFLLNRAIECYGKCGCLDDARELFDEMPQRDGGSWNAMITAYSWNKRNLEALDLFSQMNGLGVGGNEVTFAGVLGSCAAVLDLLLCRQVHGLLVKYGFCGNVILESSLVDVYGKCFVMGDARRMFDEIESPNAVTWNVIVRRYLEAGDEEGAIATFFKMIEMDFRPLNFTFSNALVACSSISGVMEGKQIHGVVVKNGLEEDVVVTDSMIDMYAKCGGLEDARRLFDLPGARDVISSTSLLSGFAMGGRISEAREFFDNMLERNVVSWNAMLAGYTRFRLWEEALDFIFLMRKTTKDLDNVTVGLILNVCAGLSDFLLGKQVHGFAYRHGFCWNDFVGNAILDMYGKCGNLRSSRIWFVEMGHLRDSVSWNALISNHARHERSEEAVSLFSEMLWKTTPSEFTFSTLLAACANTFALQQGKQIHCYMLRNDHDLDVVIRGALVDMYSKCRCFEYAFKVFQERSDRDLILWNSMILGCAHNGRGEKALELFELMLEEGIKANHVTFQGVLLGCVGEGSTRLGKQYFDSMSENYSVIPRIEHYECMIELFSRHACMNELEEFIHKMPFEPTIPMLIRIFDACREQKWSRLGEWAAARLNELDPITPYVFEIR